MKKGLFLLLAVAALSGCKKECGCYKASGTSWSEEHARFINGNYLRTDVLYYGKYKDDCGATKKLSIGQSAAKKWPNVPDICE